MSAEKVVTVRNKSVLEYFILCVTKKYFCFKGRAHRKEYWSFTLPFFIYLVFYFSYTTDASSDNLAGILSIVYLALLIPEFAVLFRRLHDINYSGWWAITPFLGITISSVMTAYAMSTGIGAILLVSGTIVIISASVFLITFILTFLKSSMKENKYGPIPEGVK